MSFPEKTTTGYVAMVTPLTDDCPPLVPGMETYYATNPVVFYQSAKALFENLRDSPTLVLPLLIVIDLAQSTNAGLDVLRELKASERLRSIPVLIRKLPAVSSVQRARPHLLNRRLIVYPDVVEKEVMAEASR